MTEMNLVSQIESINGGQMSNVPLGSRVGMMMCDSAAEIAQQLDSLKRSTQITGEELRKMEQEQESFAIAYHDCTKLNAHLQNLTNQPHTPHNIELEKKFRRQKDQQESHLNQKVTTLLQLRLTLADKLKDNIHDLHGLQSRILDSELIKYVFISKIFIYLNFVLIVMFYN